MKFHRPALVATLCASLIACGGLSMRREKVTQDQLSAGRGIVLVSVASLDKKKCMTLATDLYIRGADTGKTDAWMFVNNAYMKSDFPDYLGHVYAYALMPGEYAFWIDNANFTRNYEDGHVGQPFTVKAGEAKYLGDFWVQGCGTAQVGFRDKWSDVKDEFARIYPELNLDTVAVELIKEDP